MEFGKLKIGSLFSMSKESKLVYEKTSPENGDFVSDTVKFGIILGKDQKVQVRKKRN